MDLEDKSFVEKVLTHLCVGAQVDGFRFGLSPHITQLYFSSYEYRENVPDEIYLNIESEWTVFPSLPDPLPMREEDIEVLTEKEQYQCIFDIRRQKIVDIRLGDISPHLIITLESGKVLFVNGYHPKYECWQLSADTEWFVVAVPGNHIAVWCPDDF
jgi:hypothetical protein